jgi:hypothetical protein
LRLIKAFRRIADPAVRRRLVEQAEDLGAGDQWKELSR